MEKQQRVKVFLALLFSTIFIFSFSHFGAVGYEALAKKDEIYTAGTSIGGVDVSEQARTEAGIIINERVQNWQEETIVLLNYKESSVPVDLDFFQFDLQGSLIAAENGQSNPLIVNMKESDLQQIMKQLSLRLQITDEGLAQLSQEILQYAENLTGGDHEISVHPFITNEQTNKIISETVVQLEGASVLMADWVEELSTMTIPPKSQISLLSVMEEYGLTSMPANTMSMIATAIYETILPTNFDIVERHIGQDLPTYATLGFEAKVNPKANLDLIFSNPNDVEYTIQLQWNHPTLTVQLMGSPFLYEYIVDLSGRQEFAPKTIVQYSPQLRPPQQRVKDKGKNGLLIEVSRNVYGENGEFLRQNTISEDFYAPVERIEVHPLTSPETTETETGDDATKNGDDAETEESNTPPNETKPKPVDNENIDNDSKELWGNPNEPLKGMEGNSE